MNSFVFGFFFVFCLLIVLAIISTIYLKYYLEPKPIPIDPEYLSEESTEWINLIFERILSHFQSQKGMDKISLLINEKIAPNVLTLHSVGESPIFNTIQVENANEFKDMKFLIPIEWQNGFSFDLKMNKITIFIDIFKLKLNSLLTFPEEGKFQIEFFGKNLFQFHFSIQIFNFIFCLTQNPIFGMIIQAVFSYFLNNQKFSFDLPKSKEE
jgi:hypothetical protein